MGQVESEEDVAIRKPRQRFWLALKILSVGYLAGTVVQHGLSKSLANNPDLSQTLGVVIGLTSFLGVLIFGFNRRWSLFFASNRFSTPVILAITHFSILGTFIVQGKSGNTLVEMFFLQDVFHSFGFIFLMGLGAGGLALVCCRKRKWTIRYAGAFSAHIGLLLILLGAAIGNLWSTKGRLNMHVGDESKNILIPKTDGQVYQMELPFSVRFDKFELKHYEPAIRLMVFGFNGKKEKRLLSVDPKETKDIEILKEKFGVTFISYWSDYHRKEVVTPVEVPADKLIAPSKKQPAAIQISMPAAKGSQTVWVYDEGLSEGGRIKGQEHQLAFFWQPVRAKAYLESLEAGPKSSEHLLVFGENRIPVKVGESYALPGRNETVKVLQAFRDLVMDAQTRKPSERSNKPHNPAIEISVLDSNDKQISKTWLFAKFPGFHHQGKGANSALAHMQYEFSAASFEPPLMVIVGETQQVFKRDKDGALTPGKLVRDQSFKIGEHDFRVLSLHAQVQRRYIDTNKSDKVKNPVAQIRYKERAQFLAPGKPLQLSERRILVLADKNGDNVKDYLSSMSVIENGKKVKTHIIEVNYPLEYQGWVFYQSDYRKDDLTFSGFMVVRDPGLWVVYLGLLINFCGVALAMFLPVFSRRQKVRLAAKGSVT
ncbi:MAG: cytochrome c biogenesis protein ResB [Deltaproteobacteria bacterium]|nr:cytochrome c biogenesis protein ResB [Deltaproteobacteria bacterium]